MSNWQQTCEQQRNRLEKTEVLADKLLTLCSKAQSHLPTEILQAIRAERPRLERQLERLRANRFEVAVIGLEKAGKSALLNAWLGQEILPSEDIQLLKFCQHLMKKSNIYLLSITPEKKLIVCFKVKKKI